jgi:parvulin-like peptidyl-prolyl isomerase
MRILALLLTAIVLGATLVGCEEIPGSGENAPAMTPVPGAGTGDGATAAMTTTQGTTPAGSPAGGIAALVATVNGEPITLAEFQRQAFDTQRYFVEQGVDPNTEDGQRQLLVLRRMVLDDMINQELIEQAATDLQITVSDEEVAASIQKTIDELGGPDPFEASLSAAGTTRADVEAMERTSLIGQKVLEHISADVPTTAEFVHARHILCSSEEACQAALQRLEAGEAFDAVAREVSTDETSKQRGGDLDWVSRGMLPSSQLEDALFALAVGQRSGVVQTDFGHHVIEMLERDPERTLSEDQRYSLREKHLLDWLAERRESSEIVITIEDLKPATATP